MYVPKMVETIWKLSLMYEVAVENVVKKQIWCRFSWKCFPTGSTRVVNWPHFEAQTRPEPDIYF